MPTRARAWILGLCSVAFLATTAGFGPSGPGAKVSEEQLEYSKKLYGEGEEAMAAGNYDLALEKYREGYRYAPHLHVFTFNIASAADATGDCRTAQTYFQMFVDLVPEHPKRKEATKRLETLREECKFDAETATLNTTPEGDGEAPGGSSRESRKQREATRAMNDALAELRLAQRTYETAKGKYPDVKPFARAARRKKKHWKKLHKLATGLGVELDDRGPPDVDLADNAKRACREAESQEKRVAAAMEKVLEHYDDPKAYRLVNKILSGADRRDRPAFDACS
ncbi:MAG: hypothetical protein KDK70_31155 [Myxococcales bacterium]|nr:hypothetical protein [Myxococcales bacterium]